MKVRIATRRSPLAMWQAETVATMLRGRDPSLEVSFVSMDTIADQRLDLQISELGGKGAFSKEVQQLVQAGHADLAVHSAKDLQALTPDNLTLAAFPVRGDVRDCLVGSTLDGLREGAHVGTGSNRRRVQLAQLRPDLRFSGLRGNIATRLGQLDQFDAIVMASTALDRLGERPDSVGLLEPDTMIPQVGQGALAVECRADDEEVLELVQGIDDVAVRSTVATERDFLVELGGDCDLPAGAHAFELDGRLSLRAVLSSPDEQRVARVVLTDDGRHQAGDPARSLGARAARELRKAIA